MRKLIAGLLASVLIFNSTATTSYAVIENLNTKQEIQAKEQVLDLQKQQIETRQKMYSTQREGWEKNTQSNIEKTFKYGN